MRLHPPSSMRDAAGCSLCLLQTTIGHFGVGSLKTLSHALEFTAIETEVISAC